MHKIGITIGDPTGIGPEIVEKTIKNYHGRNKLILYGNFPDNCNIPNLQKITCCEEANDSKKNLFWIEISPNNRFVCGKPSEESGVCAYDAIKTAAKDAVQNNISAIVTAPISKHHIQIQHPQFIGHTEFFAKAAKKKYFVMSFFSEKINVGLLTTHLALKDVSGALNYSKITHQVQIIERSLKNYFQVEHPKLAILGFNPHSGEGGKFGTEEIKLFLPLVRALHKEAIDIEGPFPADTFFSGNYEKFDMIISSYHDQALIPFKMLTFGKGVNVTLGLPFVRTSVDHGTAFDIAGQNKANFHSMQSALNLAEKMVSVTPIHDSSRDRGCKHTSG